VCLYGYVTRLFLNHEKVGTICLKVEESWKDQKKETNLNCVCFNKALEIARQLKENQYVKVEGRLSKKKNKNDIWETEIIGVKVYPQKAFKEKQEVPEIDFDVWGLND
jgi:hypothetical protein